MANSPQARKRARQNEKRELHNASQRSAMRTNVKKTLKAIEQENDKDTVKSKFQDAVVLLDRAAARGLIHKNKAARIKSRLNKRAKAQ